MRDRTPPNDQLREDQQLVNRMLAGEEAAFDQFFTDYFDSLYRFASGRLEHDPQLTKDMVQNTICKALEKLDTYRGEAALFTWLCSLCRFEISAWFRRENRIPPRVELSEEQPAVQKVLEALAKGHDPSDDLQEKELRHLVHLTLDHLPPRYGRALEWKYFDGLPVQEIAARLELSPKAAESVLTRARDAFRKGFHAITRELGAGFQGLRLARRSES